MTTTLFGGYAHQNSNRRYPFEDHATLVDQDGNELPSNFIIDAHLYPMNAPAGIYLSSVDRLTQTLMFRSLADDAIVGTAIYPTPTPGPYDETAIAPVIEYQKYDRQIGVIVCGDGIADLASGRVLRTFSSAATRFCPAVYIDLTQSGVRGFLLPDGSLVTGDVTFEGQDGINVTTRTVDDIPILRFDMLGEVPPTKDECEDAGPAICHIVVERKTGSSFIVSSDMGSMTLILSTFDFSLDDMCAAKRQQYLPTADGVLPGKPITGETMYYYVPCSDPGHDPFPTDDPGDSTLTFDVCDSGLSIFNIAALSAVGYRNPISVRPTEVPAMPANRMTLPVVVTDLTDLDAAERAFRLPAMMQNGIIVGFKGLT